MHWRFGEWQCSTRPLSRASQHPLSGHAKRSFFLSLVIAVTSYITRCCPKRRSLQRVANDNG
jgi:hypothetical protein